MPSAHTSLTSARRSCVWRSCWRWGECSRRRLARAKRAAASHGIATKAWCADALRQRAMASRNAGHTESRRENARRALIIPAHEVLRGENFCERGKPAAHRLHDHLARAKRVTTSLQPKARSADAFWCSGVHCTDLRQLRPMDGVAGGMQREHNSGTIGGHVRARGGRRPCSA